MNEKMEGVKSNLRIYICGPHSTGKTTLLNDLVPHIPEINIITEVARDIIRNHGWTRDQYLPDKHPDVFLQLNKEILQKQIEIDLELSNAQGFICDRALDPIAYSGFYLGDEARETLLNVKGIHKWFGRLRSSLVFLISPHPECIVDDNVRLTSSLKELQQFYELFEEELTSHRIPYHKITALDRQQRVDLVLSKISDFTNML